MGGYVGDRRKEERFIKGHEEILGVMDMLIILIAVVVSWVYKYIETA